MSNIQLIWVRLTGSSPLQTTLLPFALNVKLQDNSVIIRRVARAWVVLSRFAVPFEPAQTGRGATEGNEAKTVSEDFVYDLGGILVSVDCFNR